MTQPANSSPLTVTRTGWYVVWTYADQDFRLATCSLMPFSALVLASYGQPRPWTTPLVACAIPSMCIMPFLRNSPSGLQIKAKSCTARIRDRSYAVEQILAGCGEHIKCNATVTSPRVSSPCRCRFLCRWRWPPLSRSQQAGVEGHTYVCKDLSACLAGLHLVPDTNMCHLHMTQVECAEL